MANANFTSKPTAKRRTKAGGDEYRQFLKIRRMPAAITDAQVEEMERAYQASAGGPEGFGPVRRASLVVLSKPCSEVFEWIKADRKTAAAFANVYVSGKEYIKFLNAVLETMTAANNRLMVGLCRRADMDELIAEASADEN